jgi:hypothetical protein
MGDSISNTAKGVWAALATKVDELRDKKKE